ncbi:MAG TPA: hypothetical protein ENH99_03250 [Candidatus Pacearchaeota archaeon]|nr:hypothetical protein [Candidatus Pacearchaeota archaeon]
MGQAEVVNFLKKCEKPVTRKEIADGLNWDPIRVSRLLKDLLKGKDIDFIEHQRDEASKLVGYVLLRRTRFFFLVEGYGD